MFIERIQLFANGQRVEDISYYGRSCFMYSLLKPSDWWTELHWEGLPVDAGGWAQPVQPGQKRDVLMHPHLIGMFNCGKMLPLQLNLVLEIEFAEPEMAMRAGVGSSLSYQIENVHLLADQVSLDSALRQSFDSILLSNRALLFSFPSLHVQQSSVPAGSTSYNITVARAFTKLLGAFVHFNKTGETHISNFEYPGEAFPNVSAATVMEGQLQLGALQFPRNSVKSIAEYHHFLAIMAGSYDSKIRNMRLPNVLQPLQRQPSLALDDGQLAVYLQYRGVGTVEVIARGVYFYFVQHEYECETQRREVTQQLHETLADEDTFGALVFFRFMLEGDCRESFYSEIYRLVIDRIRMADRVTFFADVMRSYPSGDADEDACTPTELDTDGSSARDSDHDSATDQEGEQRRRQQCS